MTGVTISVQEVTVATSMVLLGELAALALIQREIEALSPLGGGGRLVSTAFAMQPQAVWAREGVGLPHSFNMVVEEAVVTAVEEVAPASPTTQVAAGHLMPVLRQRTSSMASATKPFMQVLSGGTASIPSQSVPITHRLQR